MPELRVIAVNEDGTHLVLKSDDGQKYTLPIDERLRAATRGDRARLGQIQIEVDSQLRPRDIQARIRAGMTADEVAKLAGISVERVRRFEGPVLAERAYMAERAQKAIVRRRLDEPPQGPGSTGPGPVLGEIVVAHLKKRAVETDTVDWDSWRRDDGRWEVSLTFQAGTRSATARWSFEPQRRTVVPDDDEARSLCSEEPDRPEPTFPFVPRIASMTDRRTGGPTDDEDDLLALVNQTGAHKPGVGPGAASKPAIGSGSGSGAGTRPAPGNKPASAPGQPPRPEPERPAAAPARKAASRGAGSAYENALFSSGPVEPPPETKSVGPHRERLTGSTDRQAEADGVGRGRRATVPSWDEIVFGSRRNKKQDQ